MSEKKPWVATIDNKDDRKEFEETRRCLLNLYHSYILAHAGYVTASAIGLFTLISSFGSIQKIGATIFTFNFLNLSSLEFTWGSLIFIVFMVIVGLFSLQMIRRTFYWTYFASWALSMTLCDAIRYFNKSNCDPKTKIPRYSEEAPYSAILQYAIASKHNLESRKLYKKIWHRKGSSQAKRGILEES